MRIQGGNYSNKQRYQRGPKFKKYTVPTSNIVICPICGATNVDYTKTCVNCGSGFTSSYENPEDKYKKIKNTSIGFLLGFFLGLLGVLICIISGTSKVKKNSWSGFFTSLPFLIVIIFLLFVYFY